MGDGISYKCNKCGYKTGMMMVGGGKDWSFLYCEYIPHYCPDCKKYRSILVYCSMAEYEKIQKRPYVKEQSKLDSIKNSNESIKKKIINQQETGVKCFRCQSKNIKEMKPTDTYPCPTCGDIMQATDEMILWD